MRAIRAADRQAQGVTAEHEAQAREAAARAEHHCAGRLSVVRLPHERTSAVADLLDLTFYDDPAVTPTYPYSPSFLGEARKKHCYTRFWEKEPTEDQRWLSTLYLCSGYGFTALGQYREDRKLSYFAEHVRRHFRTIYFKMGLLIQYHRAALLKFKDDMRWTTPATPCSRASRSPSRPTSV